MVNARLKTDDIQIHLYYLYLVLTNNLQCFDADGWAAGRASDL